MTAWTKRIDTINGRRCGSVLFWMNCLAPAKRQEDPKDDKEKDAKARYAKVLGSAVNPVLREGNSDRRSAVPVKEYAYRYPHSMGAWSPESKTVVRSMDDGDFYSHESSVVVKEKCDARIELVGEDGTTTVLKEKLPLQPDEAAWGHRRLRPLVSGGSERRVRGAHGAGGRAHARTCAAWDALIGRARAKGRVALGRRPDGARCPRSGPVPHTASRHNTPCREGRSAQTAPDGDGDGQLRSGEALQVQERVASPVRAQGHRRRPWACGAAMAGAGAAANRAHPRSAALVARGAPARERSGACSRTTCRCRRQVGSHPVFHGAPGLREGWRGTTTTLLATLRPLRWRIMPGLSSAQQHHSGSSARHS